VLCSSGPQWISPLCEPVRTRRGKSRPWARKYFTVAVAEPVRVIGREQHPHGVLNLRVRIKDDRFIFCIGQAHR